MPSYNENFLEIITRRKLNWSHYNQSVTNNSKFELNLSISPQKWPQLMTWFKHAILKLEQFWKFMDTFEMREKAMLSESWLINGKIESNLKIHKEKIRNWI